MGIYSKRLIGYWLILSFSWREVLYVFGNKLAQWLNAFSVNSGREGEREAQYDQPLLSSWRVANDRGGRFGTDNVAKWKKEAK